MNFKIRFELSEYVKKVQANGSCTFSGNSTKNSLRFIFKKHNLKANTVYPSFDEEYMNHQESYPLDMKVVGMSTEDAR